MTSFRAARAQYHFSLYIHDDMAAIVKKHDIWDMVYLEADRLVVISPGVHRCRSKHGGHCNRYTGSSTLPHELRPEGWRQGLRFKGMDQFHPCPLFGVMDVIVEIDNDETMTFTLPATHNLPWIRPFRPGFWTEEDTIYFIQQRVDSALATGIELRKAVQDLKVPDMMVSFIGVEGWKKVLAKYQ